MLKSCFIGIAPPCSATYPGIIIYKAHAQHKPQTARGVSSDPEALLRAAGCKVERVAGENFIETKALLDKMAEAGRRFLT
jgi:hypothetical protein